MDQLFNMFAKIFFNTYRKSANIPDKNSVINAASSKRVQPAIPKKFLEYIYRKKQEKKSKEITTLQKMGALKHSNNLLISG